MCVCGGGGGGVKYTHVGHMKEGLKQGGVVVKRRGLR